MTLKSIVGQSKFMLLRSYIIIGFFVFFRTSERSDSSVAQPEQGRCLECAGCGSTGNANAQRLLQNA